MHITINSQSIDYTLESESTLGDVVAGIEKWLGESGLQIRSITSDGSSLDLSEKPSWETQPVEEIGSVDVVAVTPFEFLAEKLESLHGYFSTFVEATVVDSPVVSALLEERKAVAELLTTVVGEDTAGRFLDASEPKETDISALSEFSREITPVLEDRWLEIAEPEKNLCATIPALRKAISDLSDVSAYLQNGEDSEAMGRVLRFFELAQKLMRLLSSIGEQRIRDLASLRIGSESITECWSTLNGLLSELSAAITDADTITIGDLLEYEIGPRFAELIDATATADGDGVR